MKDRLRPKLRLRALRLKARIVRKRRAHTPGRMRAFGVRRKRYLTAIPLLLAAILIAWAWRATPYTTRLFHITKLDTVNPLMGWAIDAATTPGESAIKHSLVYATVTWRELEPEDGVFDFAAFEEKYHLQQWWRADKRLILRFVTDAPGESIHTDLPDWLMRALGASAGEYYENEYGKGFSPNYTNLALLQKHERVIHALGARYDDHPGVAFIEIGSVGHDGAWTSDVRSGMPLKDDTSEYMRHYLEAFPNTPMLAAAPYQPVRLMGLGLYCSYLGQGDAAWRWLDTVEFGGADETTAQELRAMGDALKVLPSGAHIGRNVDQTALYTTHAQDLIDQLSALHTTYVAGLSVDPNTPGVMETVEMANDHMGYRLWVREANWQRALRAGYRLRVHLLWRNDGAQPFSQQWLVELSLIRDGKIVYRQNTEGDIRAVAPGETAMPLTIDIPTSLRGAYQLAVAILDPRTGNPAVSLSMDAQRLGMRSILGDVYVY